MTTNIEIARKIAEVNCPLSREMKKDCSDSFTINMIKT